MPELVDDWTQVITNAEHYQSAAKQAPHVVYPAQVHCWYYFPAKGMVAPSRFLGYKDMTTERYEYYKRQNVIARGYPNPRPGEYIDGRVAEKHLGSKGWFRRLHHNDPQYPDALKLAQALCYPGEVRTKAKFYILTSS